MRAVKEKGKLIRTETHGDQGSGDYTVHELVDYYRRVYPDCTVRLYRRVVRADGVKSNAWVIVVRQKLPKKLPKKRAK